MVRKSKPASAGSGGTDASGAGPRLRARIVREPSGSCVHCGLPVMARGGFSEGPGFCCYGCAFAHQVLKDSPDGKHVSWILVQLGVAAFLAMNVMGFSLAMHASSVYPDFYARMSEPGKVYDELLRYLLFLMSAPVLMLVGAPLVENVITEARRGRWGVEGFIAASTLAAFAYSMVSTLRGRGPVYFDIAVMVLVFLTLGRYLEARFRVKAMRSLEHLLDEESLEAHLVSAGEERTVRAAELAAGDRIAVRAGERVPADARVISGDAVVEMAAMTGESAPVPKRPGEVVWSGAILAEGYLLMEVLRASGESWMARLKETLEEARRSKTQVEELARKLVRTVTFLTVACAAAAFWLGARELGPMAGVMRALSVLVIVCPCALGAAIPLALWRSFERIVRRGVLFKDLSRLEALSRVRGVFFDKTGTLTESLPALDAVRTAPGFSERELLALAASLARMSAHPYSRAVVEAAAGRGIAAYPADEVRTAVGKGLCGKVGPRAVALGNAEYMRGLGVDIRAFSAESTGSGALFMALDGMAAAAFEFREKLRPEARACVARLKTLGYPVFILTGDEPVAARRVAADLGVEAEAGLSPQEKLDRIRAWERRHGPALVVGEGLNDAPMIAAAGVSLAMGGALARTREAADFTLPDDDLSSIPWLLSSARQTLSRIRTNLFWAFFYNGLAVPLAVMGLVNPIVAAMAMIASSAFIILHSLKSEKEVS